MPLDVDLVRLVVQEGFGVTMRGQALGLVGSAGLTRFFQAVLFGVMPLDRLAFTDGLAVLIVVASLSVQDVQAGCATCGDRGEDDGQNTTTASSVARK